MPQLFSILVFGIIGMLVFRNREAVGDFMEDVYNLGTSAENKKLFAPYIARAEVDYDIPSGLLMRLIDAESSFRSDIISGAVISQDGAIGIAQIIPKWHPNVDPLNPTQAIEYAGWYLRENYEKFHDWQKALAAYNWGPANLANAIAKYGNNWFAYAPAETRNYVQRILV